MHLLVRRQITSVFHWTSVFKHHIIQNDWLKRCFWLFYLIPQLIQTIFLDFSHLIQFKNLKPVLDFFKNIFLDFWYKFSESLMFYFCQYVCLTWSFSCLHLSGNCSYIHLNKESGTGLRRELSHHLRYKHI